MGMENLHKFRKHFQLSPKADLGAVAVAVDSVYKANELALNFIGNIDNKTDKDGFLVHSHLNIMGRIFEQTLGMLVCIATRCPTSSEALARIVVEGSINLIYMTQKGDSSTLVGFLESWLVEHERKLNEWKNKLAGHKYELHVVKMINERLSLLSYHRIFLNQIIEKCGIERKPHREVWPKSLYKRFCEIGRETDYYESYHRLSGSSHISGEDTLSYLLTLNVDETYRYRVGQEAVSFSIMMSRIASLFFIDAASACCVKHGIDGVQEFEDLKSRLVVSISEISDAAGVPK